MGWEDLKDRNQVEWDASNENPPWVDQKPNQDRGQALLIVMEKTKV